MIEIAEGIMFLLLLAVMIISSFTDIRGGYIYNKILLPFAISAVVMDAVYYGYFNREQFLIFVANVIVIFIVSAGLFYTNSFAGGDAKLLMTISLLYPAREYIAYKRSLLTLFMAVGIGIVYGYIYLLLSTIVQTIRRKNKITFKYAFEYITNYLKFFICTLLYVSVVNGVIAIIQGANVYVSDWIIRIVCIVVAFSVGQFSIFKKWYSIVAVIVVNIGISIYLKTLLFSTDISTYYLVICLMLCRMIIGSGLYEEIQVQNIRKGIILSTATTIMMQNSKIEGLPGISTEDLKSRLTETEANSVKLWAEKKQIESLMVVKKIPLGIFIALGFCTYYFIWSITV